VLDCFLFSGVAAVSLVRQLVAAFPELKVRSLSLLEVGAIFYSKVNCVMQVNF